MCIRDRREADRRQKFHCTRRQRRKTARLQRTLRKAFGQASALSLIHIFPLDSAGHEKRHIVSVFKLVQELLAPGGQNKKTGFQVLMDNLPSTHKARWFAGAALNTSEQGNPE